MGLKTTLDLAHGRLEQLGIPHALIGGMALSLWGAQRSTADIDLLVDGGFKVETEQALTALGFTPFHATAEILQFNGIGSLDVMFANRPLSLKMLAEAQVFPHVSVRCVRPEGLIGLKIQAYKNNAKRTLQDKADIQRLMEANPTLDLEEILDYARHFGEEREMERLWTLARTPS